MISSSRLACIGQAKNCQVSRGYDGSLFEEGRKEINKGWDNPVFHPISFETSTRIRRFVPSRWMNRRRNNKSGIFFEPMNRLNLHRHFKNFDIFKIRLFSFQLRILNEIFLFLLRNFINRSERDRSTKKNSIKKKKERKKKSYLHFEFERRNSRKKFIFDRDEKRLSSIKVSVYW